MIVPCPAQSVDCTDIIQNAIQTVRGGGEIEFEPGVYLIRPDVLQFVGRRFRGRNTHATKTTILRAIDSGEKLIEVTSQVDIRGIVLDCANQVETGLYASSAHSSDLSGIVAMNATGHGIVLHESTLYGSNLLVTKSAKGVLIRGANASTLVHLRALTCQGVGLQIEGAAMAGPTTGQAGKCSITGPHIGNCGKDGVSPQVRILGWEAGLIQGGYVEGATDGFVLDDGTHNCSFVGIPCSGGETRAAWTLGVGVRGNTFMGLTAPGENYATFRCVEATAQQKNSFLGCWRNSRAAGGVTPFTFT